MRSTATQLATSIMEDFAERTAIWGDLGDGTRYLWTDAFAVRNYLNLHLRTQQSTQNIGHLEHALRLIEQVHHTLGKHRPDDERSGWISGLAAELAELHPTVGGLRIGKPMNERGDDEPYDERVEWDRDGQYFHYLTKWIDALHHTAVVTHEHKYFEWAAQLARSARRAFVQSSADKPATIFWKMSIDLSRPLIGSMGRLDALDGFVTYSSLQATADQGTSGDGDHADLHNAITDFFFICRQADWVNDDELGIGSLLADAARLIQLLHTGSLVHTSIIEKAVAEARISMDQMSFHRLMHRPASMRLAFREFGLSIGLHQIRHARSIIEQRHEIFEGHQNLISDLDQILKHEAVADQIERYWLDPTHQSTTAWTRNTDINAVMLATSLLSDDPRSLRMGREDGSSRILTNTHKGTGS